MARNQASPLSALISKLRALLDSARIPDVALTSSLGYYRLLLPADVWLDVEAASEAIDSGSLQAAR